jgi:hypothetical protein
MILYLSSGLTRILSAIWSKGFYSGLIRHQINIRWPTDVQKVRPRFRRDHVDRRKGNPSGHFEAVSVESLLADAAAETMRHSNVRFRLLAWGVSDLGLWLFLLAKRGGPARAAMTPPPGPYRPVAIFSAYLEQTCLGGKTRK